MCFLGWLEVVGSVFARCATWCTYVLAHVARFGEHYFGDSQCLSSIFSKIMMVMRFERLFGGMCGGSNSLGTHFGDCVYNK